MAQPTHHQGQMQMNAPPLAQQSTQQQQQQQQHQQQQMHQIQMHLQQQQQHQQQQPQQQQQQQQQTPQYQQIPQMAAPPQQPQQQSAPAAAAARPNFQMALLPPPQDRLYPSFEALQNDLKTFTRSQGYACVIVSSLNRDVEGRYRRYNLCCSKGGKGYTSHSKGIRQSRSTKTGCPMRLKAVQEKAWPYDDKWRIIVQVAEHNHEPFTGEPGGAVPPQFRKIEQDGVRWLMIMHREAQCSLRQLTIGIRISFGDKYQYVKKSDVRNMLAKIKRDEDRKAATAAVAQGLPTNLSYTLIPQSHQPPPPAPQDVEKIPQLPQGLQVPDPDLESDDEDDEEL